MVIRADLESAKEANDASVSGVWPPTTKTKKLVKVKVKRKKKKDTAGYRSQLDQRYDSLTDMQLPQALDTSNYQSAAKSTLDFSSFAGGAAKSILES